MKINSNSNFMICILLILLLFIVDAFSIIRTVEDEVKDNNIISYIVENK